MNNLDEAISEYRNKLQRMVGTLSEPEENGIENRVKGVLIARDNVADLASDNKRITPTRLGLISESDRDLKDSAGVIVSIIGQDALVNWRESIQAPSKAWWWFLDIEASHAEEKRNAWLTIITVITATSIVILITDLLSRFIGDGGGTIDKANPVTQLIIAVIGLILSLLGGAALTESKYPSLERVLPNLEIFKSHKAKKRAVVTGIFLLVAITSRLSLPVVAKVYQKKGYDYQQQNNLSVARECYQRALRLYPDYAKAHYSLATVYEDYQQLDVAAKEYNLAIESDSKLYPAYNNLARLYLLREEGKDVEKALQILSDALQSSPTDESIQYSLYKNLGWANLNLKNYTQANTDLKKAIALKPEGAAAHCLLVYVLEALSKPRLDASTKQRIVNACESCIAYSPGEQDVKAEWVGHSNEILNQEEEQNEN